MKHKLIVIGPVGQRHVYLDLPLETAVDRFRQSMALEHNQPVLQLPTFGADLEEFEFEDEFRAYDVYPT